MLSATDQSSYLASLRASPHRGPPANRRECGCIRENRRSSSGRSPVLSAGWQNCSWIVCKCQYRWQWWYTLRICFCSSSGTRVSKQVTEPKSKTAILLHFLLLWSNDGRIVKSGRLARTCMVHADLNRHHSLETRKKKQPAAQHVTFFFLSKTLFLLDKAAIVVDPVNSSRKCVRESSRILMQLYFANYLTPLK